MTFRLRWPDGTTSTCYSPSLVVHDHLQTDVRYPLTDFLQRSHRALEIASERVEARWGRPCALAKAQIKEIDRRAADFAAVGGDVEVLSMESISADAPGGTP